MDFIFPTQNLNIDDNINISKVRSVHVVYT
jgi:hypothetical protein